MSLRFMDSFDHYSINDLIGLGYGQKWSYQASGNNNMSLVLGRFGSGLQSILSSGGNYSWVNKAFDNQPTWCVGLAFKCPGFINNGAIVCTLADGVTPQVELRITSLGQLYITRNGTTLTSSTSTLNMATNTWYYIEWLCTISPSITLGQCQVNVNGANWINVPAGQSTRNSANSYASVISLFMWGGALPYNTGAQTLIVDDLYILDGTGSAPLNTFLGDVRVECRFPTANSSTNNNWTPSAGSAFGCINDPVPNGDSSYIYSATTNDISTFTLPSLSSPATTIFGVQLTHCTRKTDVGTRQVADTIRSASTNYPNATPVNLSTSYAYYSSVYPNDPATSSAWTTTSVNAMEIGLKEIT
jgi:hypothetical protein